MLCVCVRLCVLVGGRFSATCLITSRATSRNLKVGCVVKFGLDNFSFENQKLFVLKRHSGWGKKSLCDVTGVTDAL